MENVEVEVEKGIQILVQIGDEDVGTIPRSRAGDVLRAMDKSFAELLAPMTSIAKELRAAVKSVAPAKTEVEFGLKFTGEGKLVLVRGEQRRAVLDHLAERLRADPVDLAAARREAHGPRVDGEAPSPGEGTPVGLDGDGTASGRALCDGAASVDDPRRRTGQGVRAAPWRLRRQHHRRLLHSRTPERPLRQEAPCAGVAGFQSQGRYSGLDARRTRSRGQPRSNPKGPCVGAEMELGSRGVRTGLVGG